MPLKRIQEQSGTMNQYSAPSLLPDNQSQLLVNVSQKYFGTWSHRPGTTLFGDLISSSNQVRGLHAYEKGDGTHYFHAVHDGTLYVLNEGTATWGSQEANVVGATSEVDFTNYLQRHYFIGNGATEYLSYATETGNHTKVVVATGTVAAGSTGSTLVASTGIFNSGMVGFLVTNTTETPDQTRTITAYMDSTTVTVDTAINDGWDGDTIEIYMDGKYLANNDAYMVVAGSTVQPLRTYATTLDSDDFDVAADYVRTNTPPTGVASFGNGREFIVFTSNNYVTWNPKNNQVTVVDKYGCSSHRSIQNLNGVLIWFDRGHFYRLAYNESFPTKISLPMTNEANNDAILDQMPSTNYEVVASGVDGNSYFARLGNLSSTVKGVTLNDCIVEIDVSTEGWKAHTYTAGGVGSVFANFIDSDGARGLYAGSVDNGAIYKMNVQGTYTDDDSAGAAQAVNSTIITKQYEFGDKEVYMDKDTKMIHQKYYAAATINMDYAVNGSTTFADLKTLPIITDDWEWKAIKMVSPSFAKSLTLKYQTTGNFVIHEHIFEFESRKNAALDYI